MNALHDETRARWGAQPPEEFIGAVMHGALRHKLDMASIVIHVYAQIVHQFPKAGELQVQPMSDQAESPVSLRDLFVNMRTCISQAQTAVHDEPVSSVLPYSPEWYITHITNEIRHYMSRLEAWARAIEAEPQVESLTLPGARGKSFGDVALEIWKHTAAVNQVLDFAQAYVDKRGLESSS